MIRVTSLTAMSDRQLNRWIKRIALILVVGAIAFVGFYIFDRWRPPTAPIVDREIASLEAAIQTDPTDIASRGRLADLYVTKERFEEAIVQYRAILETGKQDELAHYGLAVANQGLGDLDAAAKEYEAVVDIAAGGEMANVDPMLNAAYYRLGEIALGQGRADDAVKHLTAAVNIKRSDADALNLLGKAMIAAGQPKDAIDVLKRAIAFVPLGWTEPYVSLAQAYGATGDQARAEWASAMADLSNGDVETAKQRLLAIADGPAALEATIGLGLVHERSGDLTGAAEWYGKALAIDPDNAEALLALDRVTAPVSPAPISPAPVSPAPASSPLPSLPNPGSGGNG